MLHFEAQLRCQQHRWQRNKARAAHILVAVATAATAAVVVADVVLKRPLKLNNTTAVVSRLADDDIAQPEFVAGTGRAAAYANKQADAQALEGALHVRRHRRGQRGARHARRQTHNDNVVRADMAEQVEYIFWLATLPLSVTPCLLSHTE